MERKRRSEKSNSTKNIVISVIMFVIVAVFSYFGVENFDELFDVLIANNNTEQTVETNALIDTEKIVKGDFTIHFIDVGQADSIYITNGNHSMLIDGGNNGDGELIVDYLKTQGVQTLDYIIATHPHEDHIGGLDNVLDNFDCNKVLMPNKITTTKTFESFLISIKNRQEDMKKRGIDANLKYIPHVGETFYLADATFTILAPNSLDYGEELNNYSIVIKMVYGDNTFLFTGDAETKSEKEILAAGYDLQADVLKVGHHGSNTSTSDEFLDAISPRFAVILVGKDNTYNLPRKTTMDKLKQKNIPVYRTDESGTIICTSDGTNITFDKDVGSYSYMK